MEKVIGKTTRSRAVFGALASLLAAAILLAAGTPGPAAQAASEPQAHASRPFSHLVTQGLYLSTAVYGGRAWSWYQPARVESWIAADGSGREATNSAKAWFASQEDRETWEAAGKPRFLVHGFRPHRSVEAFGPGSIPDLLYDTELVTGMPTEVEPLADWLRDLASQPARGGGNGFEDSVKTIEFLGEFLRNPALTPSQRLDLYEAETKVAGVEVLGPVKDAIGREGTAIAAQSANSGALTRYSLIVDPGNGRILESEDLILKAPAYRSEWAGPQLSSRETYLEPGAAGASRSGKGRAGRKHAHRR
jgi:hypothetical protein